MTARTVLITGAAGYLGSALAHGFASAGWKVLANARSEARLGPLLASLAGAAQAAEPAVFDVTDEESVARFFAARPGLVLSTVINNAYAGGAGTVETSASHDYLAAVDVTVAAAHRVLRAALPALRAAREQGQASNVINIASMYALVSPDLRVYRQPESANPPFYGAAKAALLQWTRYAAVEFAPEGIRVNALTPGPFPSPDVQDAAPEFVSELARHVPLGRVGSADELVAPALFLASDGASFVTGANLVVDGGWTAW